jgi:hypothetical protein
MGTPLFIPSFSLSNFAGDVSSPYTSLSAYQKGIIDENGNLKKNIDGMDAYEFFIWKLKKIFEQIPMSYTKASLQQFPTTFKLFSEEAKQFNINPIECEMFLNGYLESLMLNEDVGAAIVSGSAPAGSLGVPAESKNEGGIMGYDVRMGMPMARRKSMMQMFDVDKDEYENFKKAKSWKELQDSKTKKYLQRYQRRNKDSKMAVRFLDPETGKQEVHWIKLNRDQISETREFLNFADFLNEDVKSSKTGRHAGHVIDKLVSKIGSSENYDIRSLDKDQTEYVGRMIDWVNGFHAASISGESGHAEEWIDLGAKNATKIASKNDSIGPEADPDGFRYDPLSKSKNFQDRVKKIDYGTDRKPVGELSRKREGISVAGSMVSLPKEGRAFKDEVKKILSEPSSEQQFRDEIKFHLTTPQTILHRRTTGRNLDPASSGFVSHETKELKDIVNSKLFNLNPAVGKPTTNEPFGRQTVKSLDLRTRSLSSPSVGSEMGYDAIRTISGTDEPKEALSVSPEAIDHLFDNIPDNYVGENKMNKDQLRSHVTKILTPHISRGRYPLLIPSSKTISV